MRCKQSKAFFGLIAFSFLTLGLAGPIYTAPPDALSAPHALHAGFAVETPADIQQRASCVVQIDVCRLDLSPISRRTGRGDFSMGQESSFDAKTAAWLFASTALTEPVVQASLDQKPGTVGTQVFIAAEASGDRFVRLEVSLKKTETPWPDNAANRLLIALVDRVRIAANESKIREKAAGEKRLQTLTKRLAADELQLKEVRETRRSVETVIGSNIAYNDPSSIIRNIKMSIATNQANLERSKSRLAALEVEPLTFYENNVKAAEENLAKLTESAKEGKATAAEIASAATDLSKVKARLASARAAAESLTHDRLAGTREAGTLRTAIAQNEAELETMKKQLAKLEDPAMTEKIAAYRKNDQEETRLQNEVMFNRETVRILQQALGETSTVDITILDGAAPAKDSAEKPR